MPLNFTYLAMADVVELPRRKGRVERWEVVFLNDNRVKLKSLLVPGAFKIHMYNQFNLLGYDLVSALEVARGIESESGEDIFSGGYEPAPQVEVPENYPLAPEL